MDLRITARIAWKRLLTLVIFALLAIALRNYFTSDLNFIEFPLLFLGLVVLLLLSIRSFVAYQRWSEANKEWATLIGEIRSSASLISVHISGDERKSILYRYIAFLYSTRNHLRKIEFENEVQEFLLNKEFSGLRPEHNVPLQIITFQHAELRLLQKKDLISTEVYALLQQHLHAMMRAFTQCECIKNTIPPRQYSYYAGKSVAAFSFLLPFFLADKSQWWFVLISTLIIGFVLFAIDSIAKGVENPFDNTINDVAMSSWCRTAENELRSFLGETALPPPVQPVNGFLY